MYHRVGQALKETGLLQSSHPTDWLIFLCPGKREAYGEHLERLAPANETFAKIFRQTLRFPIYVHSKMMIVDDAYIILGNIFFVVEANCEAKFEMSDRSNYLFSIF